MPLTSVVMGIVSVYFTSCDGCIIMWDMHLHTQERLNNLLVNYGLAEMLIFWYNSQI